MPGVPGRKDRPLLRADSGPDLGRETRWSAQTRREAGLAAQAHTDFSGWRLESRASSVPSPPPVSYSACCTARYRPGTSDVQAGTSRLRPCLSNPAPGEPATLHGPDLEAAVLIPMPADAIRPAPSLGTVEQAAGKLAVVIGVMADNRSQNAPRRGLAIRDPESSKPPS